MRRLAALLAAAATVSVIGVATAPAAHACASAPCERFCHLWETGTGRSCPLR